MKLSIIIPVFNTENYLRQCLDSVIFQDFKDFEVICVDNGSTDSSFNIMKEYEGRHQNVHALQYFKGRQGGARNYAMKLAKGEYIGFVDSDDLINPRMYKIMLDLAQFFNGDLVVCEKNTFTDWDDKLNIEVPSDVNIQVFEYYSKLTKIGLFESLGPCTKIFRKEFVSRENLFFPEDTFYEDQYFVINAYLRSRKIVYTSEVFYYYRKLREGSVTNTVNGNWSDLYYVWNMIENNLKDLVDEGFLMTIKVKRVYEIFNLLNAVKRYNLFRKLKTDCTNKIVLTHLLKRREKYFWIFVSRYNYLSYVFFVSLNNLRLKLKN